MRKYLFYILSSFFLGLLVMWSIRVAGDWYPMHDSTHLTRVLLMQQTIMGGQFPPIWASGIGSGLGYPLFHFYAPLFHLIATVFAFLPISVSTAVKLTLYLFSVVGSLGVMMFTKRWGKTAAIVAAIAFALSPYAAVNLYVRGAYAEFASLAILPWVFLTTEKLTSKKSLVIASITLSLFVLSHNLIPILVLPMIVVWITYHNSKHISKILGSILLSVILSSWFVLPLIFERHFTVADTMAKTTSYALHYAEPWQLWNSTWGFGGSAIGVEDGMSFKLGKLQIILGLLGVVFAFRNRHKSFILLTFFLFVSAFLATKYSSFIWDQSSILQLVQFPWRTLGIIALLLSILAGYAISSVPSRLIRILTTILIIIMLSVLNLKYFVPQSVLSAKEDNPTMQLSQLDDIALVVPEFKPIWLTRDNPLIVGSTVLPVAYYPTWQVILDDQVVITYPSQDGKLAFSNPSGSTNYSYRQSHTKLEQISILISLSGVITSLFIYLKSKDNVKA